MSVSKFVFQQLLTRLYPVLIWGALLGLVAHSALTMDLLPESRSTRDVSIEATSTDAQLNAVTSVAQRFVRSGASHDPTSTLP